MKWLGGQTGHSLVTAEDQAHRNDHTIADRIATMQKCLNAIQKGQLSLSAAYADRP